MFSFFLSNSILSFVFTLHPSMLIAPTPHFKTFSAIDNPFSKGFLASTIGSFAGFKALPQPFHCFAWSVEGAVKGIFEPSFLLLFSLYLKCIFSSLAFEYDLFFLPQCSTSPNTSLSAPYILSIALLILCDFGKPLPYNHCIQSLTSKPANRIAITPQSYVLLP